MKSALVLCSGGLDSVTTAYYIKSKYKKITILFFNYGQKSLNQERKYSKICAKHIKANFVEINLSALSNISNSLINKPGKVNKISRKDLKNIHSESEKWYVPARNLIFLSYATSLAEALYDKEKMEYDIFVGFKNEGIEHYPDTTKEFTDSFNKLINISTNSKTKVFAPLISKDKEDIVLLAKKLGIDFRNTFSCYVGEFNHCGHCLACRLRKEGFHWANIEDPTIYNKYK